MFLRERALISKMAAENTKQLRDFPYIRCCNKCSSGYLVLCRGLLRTAMLIQQYSCWFIIQTNEALFLSKHYLLSDNKKLGGCITPRYQQPKLSFSFLLSLLSSFLCFCRISKDCFVSFVFDLTCCTFTILKRKVTSINLLLIKRCRNSIFAQGKERE